ncbi:hypothetical protein [Myxococcus sp. AS-1-15]|jgi:hypothetical protein|uniref:hypothetical protein n=1 Tax=Myxococcus TaxID=32 RepID=UPI001CC13BA2|nr:hypothetical protein [Myxococcus sp. AS-1-15]MBZ4398894.1 hypothetical protein [Myxococcus sp. AS-1-15]BDT36076.1 hypothetical protein MFMH1_57450 [Myxococcus sp. MH1]
MFHVGVRLVLLAVLSLIIPSAAMAANAVAGTASHGQAIAAPTGTSVSDWNVLLVPRGMGFQELGSEGDNALLRFEVSAPPLNSTAWSVSARFKYRNSSGNGTWYSGSVDYLLVRKSVSVGGTLTNGESIAVPAGTSMADWNIIVSPASAGLEETGAEFDNSLLRFSASYSVVNSSTWQIQSTFKFRYSNQGLSLVHSGQASYLLVLRDESFVGSTTHGQNFTVQGNTSVSDWSTLVIPSSVGHEEPGSEGDNALLGFDSAVEVANTNQWRPFGAFKYRFHNGDGSWQMGPLSYIIVRN